MKESNIFDHPKLKYMDLRKKKILINLVTEAKGKPLTKCLPYIMKANTSLRSEGLSLTQEETNILMELLTKDMSPEELQRFDMMKKMMETQTNNQNNRKR